MNKICTLCETREATLRHHIVPRKDDGCNHEKNLIELCKKCHAFIHQVYGFEGMIYKESSIGWAFFSIHCLEIAKQFAKEFPDSSFDKYEKNYYQRTQYMSMCFECAIEQSQSS